MMQMNRTFHQTGAELPAVGVMPAHLVTTRKEYPGEPVRYATLFPFVFNPNPLPMFVKIQYKNTAIA
jgi:hypothetical protein